MVVYKRKNGSWVKVEAYVRKNGGWEQNSTTVDHIVLTDIASYYQDPTVAALTQVQNLDSDEFAFCIVTDTHGNKNRQNSQNIIRYLMKNGIKRFFHLGDTSASLFSLEETRAYFAPLQNCRSQMYYALGNHETYGTPDYTGLYNITLSDKTDIVGNPSSFYYYLDDEESKVRFIVINTSDGGEYAFGEQQRIWLNSAVQCPSDWSIVFLGHVDIDNTAEAEMQTWVSPQANTILNCMKSSTGNVVGYFCGHMHFDRCKEIGNSGIYETAVLNDSCEKDTEISIVTNPDRTAGTVSEQAVSVVKVNTTTGDVNIIRIGAGINMDYNYKSNTNVTTGSIIGVTGMTDSTGMLTLTDDAANVAVYNTTTSGDYVSVQNDLDNLFPFNKIEEFTDAEGNVMVKFPKFWMKWIEDGNGYIDGYKISDYQVDESYFIPDAFLDPKDTTGNTYLDYFALGKYEGSGSNNKLYSKTGAPCYVDCTRADARSSARAYGNSNNFYNGYQLMDYAQRVCYNLLVMLYYRTQNLQTVHRGRVDTSSVSIVGTTDGCVGMNGWNTSTACIKFLGIENPYGNVYEWVDGVYNTSAQIHIERFPQRYHDNFSGISFGFSHEASSSTSGYIKYFKNGTTAETKSYISPCVMSSWDNANAEMYCGDIIYLDTSGLIAFGGAWDSSSKAGLWSHSIRETTTTKTTWHGARLAYRPV